VITDRLFLGAFSQGQNEQYPNEARVIQGMGFLARFFLALACFHFASAFSKSVFETVSTLRKALSNFSASVLPGTFGAGCGFTSSVPR
jgi:hypothetical protein